MAEKVGWPPLFLIFAPFRCSQKMRKDAVQTCSNIFPSSGPPVQGCSIPEKCPKINISNSHIPSSGAFVAQSTKNIPEISVSKFQGSASGLSMSITGLGLSAASQSFSGERSSANRPVKRCRLVLASASWPKRRKPSLVACAGGPRKWWTYRFPEILSGFLHRLMLHKSTKTTKPWDFTLKSSHFACFGVPTISRNDQQNGEFSPFGN